MSYSEREELFMERLIEAGWLPPPEQPAKPWFQTDQEALRWIMCEANQWKEDNQQVAAHLIEVGHRFHKLMRGAK